MEREAEFVLKHSQTNFFEGPDIDPDDSIPSVPFHWSCATLSMGVCALREPDVSAARRRGLVVRARPGRR